jgi:hypothetical protein
MPTLSLDFTISFDYEVTSNGHPGTAPSLSHPGDPPEPPEFDIGAIEFRNHRFESILGESGEDEFFYLLYSAMEEAVIDHLLETQDEGREPDYPDPPF